MHLALIEFQKSENILCLGNKMYWLQDEISYIPVYFHVHTLFQKLKDIAQFPFGFLDFFS